MASPPSKQAQPGDGMYLLQNGASSKTKKRRPRGGRRKKEETFLVRRDSVVDGNEHSTPSPQTAAHRRAKKLGCAPVNDASSTIGHEELLSDGGTSHRFLRGSTKNFDTQSRLHSRPHLTQSFLLQHNVAEPLANQGLSQVHSTEMPPGKAIPPHLSMKHATTLATVANNAPNGTKTDRGKQMLPPSPPESDDVPVELPVSDETTDSSRPNPVSEPPSEKQVFYGRANMKSRGRGGGRGGGQANRASTRKPANDPNSRAGHGFLKSSEIPKGDKKRWDTDWTGNNHVRNRKSPVSAAHHNKSNSFDTSADVDTAGGRPPRSVDSGGWSIPREYDGGLAPAPMDWDFRPGFRKGQNEEQIQRWIDMMEGRAMINVNRQPILEDLSVVDGFTYTFASPTNPEPGVEYRDMGDIVPQYWKRDHFFGNIPPATFYDQNIKSDTPRPVHEDDLADARPWWETLVRGGSFLQPYSAPEVKGMDPDECVREKLHRECDFGSRHHAANAKRRELAKQGITLEKMKRSAENNEKKARLKQSNGGTTPEYMKPINDHQLGKIYLRHATSDDMEAIRDIYNYYVDFSSAVPESKRLDKFEIHEQFIDITQHSKLPYLVAYEKGALLKGNRRIKGYRPGVPIQLPDTIVGFIRADEYGSGADMYRFTAVVEVFTHKDYLQKSIAKCLMDKMLGLLDPDHIERGGYQVADAYLDAASPVRNIKNIMVNYIYPSDVSIRIERMERWMLEDIHFEQVGHIPDIGTKLGHSISKAIFVRETGAVLDHTSPPEEMRIKAAKKH